MSRVECEIVDCPAEANRSPNWAVWISLAGLLAGGLGYVLTQATWKGSTDTRLINLEEADKRISNEQKSQRDETRNDLKAINDKLDRLLERGR